MARRADLLAFQAQEIESAQLKTGEEDELRRERDRLANAENLASLARQALALLDEGSPRIAGHCRPVWPAGAAAGLHQPQSTPASRPCSSRPPPWKKSLGEIQHRPAGLPGKHRVQPAPPGAGRRAPGAACIPSSANTAAAWKPPWPLGGRLARSWKTSPTPASAWPSWRRPSRPCWLPWPVRLICSQRTAGRPPSH